jgi:hypothetical protein
MTHPCPLCYDTDSYGIENCPAIKIKYILPDSYGIFMAYEFANQFRGRIKPKSNTSLSLFEQSLLDINQSPTINGKSSDDYWESWAYILDNCIVYHEDQWWYLHQDNDLYFYQTDGMIKDLA